MFQEIKGTSLVYELEDDFVKKSREAGSYLNRIKDVNLLPFSNLDLFFSDNIWDFTPSRKLNIKKSSMIFRFECVCEHYRDELKKYVLSQLIDGGAKIQSIHGDSDVIARFLNYAFKGAYYEVCQFDAKLITEFIQQMNGQSKSYLRNTSIVIRNFMSYYSMHYEDVWTSEIERSLDDRQYRMSAMEKEQLKRKDIPKQYYDSFLKAAISIVDSCDAPTIIKAGTCILLMLSQTGLRIGEILDLRCRSLNKAVSYNGKELFYLKYGTWKRERGNNVFTVEKTFANAITIKAYKVLMDLYREERLSKGYKYLYLGNLRKNDSLELPVSPDRFAYTQKEVFVYMNRYFQTINLPDEKKKGLSTCNSKVFERMKKYYPDAETLTYPITPQFRVHVCTDLYARGCTLPYIQKFMGHLSNEMMGYYVRTDPHNCQEDFKYAQEVFKKIITDDAKLLGGSADSLKSRIDAFIQENGYHIEQDMDAIIDLLTGKMPVRQKIGGVCIRSSAARECSKDAMTNEFYCAYSVCPNIFHFFYMSGVSYRQASELWKSISINVERGFMRQAYKEARMLNGVVIQKLIPAPYPV